MFKFPIKDKSSRTLVLRNAQNENTIDCRVQENLNYYLEIKIEQKNYPPNGMLSKRTKRLRINSTFSPSP